MRTFAVTLAQNLGTSTLGAILDISLAGPTIGTWNHEVEKDLTRISPSDQTVKVTDSDGSIWTWLQNHVQTDGAIYPLWVAIDVDGRREFTGLAMHRDIRQDQKEGVISITAQDWSATLSSKYLGAEDAADDLNPLRNPWLRGYPRGARNRPAATQMVHVYATPGDYAMVDERVGPMEFVVDWHGPQQFVEPGDWVTCAPLHASYSAFPDGKKYKCLSIQQVKGEADWWSAEFDGLIWDVFNTIGSLDADFTFTRVAIASDLKDYYTVTKTVAADAKGVFTLDLDLVDNLVSGDTVRTIGTASARSWTVLQVDPELLQVVTKEEVTDVVAGVSRIFYSEESLNSQVLMDARVAIRLAAAPYAVYLRRLVPPTVSTPVLVWLPLRPLDSEDLTTVRDLDPGLASVRVFGTGTLAWDGSPEAGWVANPDFSPRAHWTDQRLSAPSSLMPWEAATLIPTAPGRNRATWLGYRDNGDITWDPSLTWAPRAVLVYDYTLMRRILIQADRSIAIQPWTGSAWGESVAATWPGTQAVGSASVFPGVAGAVVAITAIGLQLVTLPTGVVSNVCAIPDGGLDGVLRTTPWGCYLVSSQGYGRLSYAAGVLSIAWVTLTDAVSTFYPATFQGLSDSEIVVLARFDGPPSTSDQSVVTETHLLRLAGTPSGDAAAALLGSEKLLDGASRTVGAVRDPSLPGRVIGHCGGRLFVISRTLPMAYAIERFSPAGLKGAELIEHICQVINAVAVPDALGTLHIISRGLLETPANLVVDRVEVEESQTWEHFYSLVRVSSANDSAIFSDAKGVRGGEILEYSQHPLLWTQSGCDATAQGLSAWFGVKRRFRSEKWFMSDSNAAAPWESLPPLATVRINGETDKWLVIGINDDKVNGEATAQLVEVF